MVRKVVRFMGKTVNGGRGRVYIYIPKKVQEKYGIKPNAIYVVELKGPITEEDLMKLVEE